jgi:protein-S-isoprenylcysteine O-methyltransferase Ste14
MERALYAEDPKFASSLRSTSAMRATRGRAALGVLGVLAGLALLLAGVATMITAMGVAGFVLMLVGAVGIYSAIRSTPAAASADESAAPAPRTRKSDGFMNRLEDRWHRRADEDPRA